MFEITRWILGWSDAAEVLCPEAIPVHVNSAGPTRIENSGRL